MVHSMLAQMLGVYVVEERKKKKINQAQLAKMIDCTPQFLGRFEKGEVMLPKRLLLKAVTALNLKYDKLKSIHAISSQADFEELFAIQKSSLRRAR